MPQTVPNRPTNGAVEPTVASTARPSWVRLCTVLTARSMLCVTQVFRSTWPIRPSCLRVASSADSAMKR
jgi:hypothetical protein